VADGVVACGVRLVQVDRALHPEGPCDEGFVGAVDVGEGREKSFLTAGTPSS
jgi:hypothetical protein